MIHFFVPFLINTVSAVTLILVTAKQRTTAKRQQTYQSMLKEQFQQQKHLLIASIDHIIHRRLHEVYSRPMAASYWLSHLLHSRQHNFLDLYPAIQILLATLSQSNTELSTTDYQSSDTKRHLKILDFAKIPIRIRRTCSTKVV